MTRPAEELLAEALRLSPAERSELAHRLLKSTAGSSPGGGVRAGRARWETLQAARGVVHLGGDAVEDCERLYDG